MIPPARSAFNPESSDFDFLVELDTQTPGARGTGPSWPMTDKTPKLLVDALGAIESAQEFVVGGGWGAD